MGLDMSTYNTVLKEVYLPPIREQLNNKVVLLAQVDKNSEHIIGGRYGYMAGHFGRSTGAGARRDGATLPNAGNQRYDDIQVPIQHNYGRVQITGPTMRASATSTAAFERAAPSEMRRMMNDVKTNINRQVWGTSNGVIGQCGTTTASTTVVLSNFTAVQMRQLFKDEHIDIGTVAAPTTIASDREITAINYSAKTIVISGAAVTTSSTHFVFKQGAGGAAGGVGQSELTGVQSIVAASGTLFNVDPSVQPEWAATVLDNSAVNRALTEPLMSRLCDEVDIVSGCELDLWFGSHGVVRSFEAILTAQKGFYNTVDLKGGSKGLEFAHGSAPKAVVADKDTPNNAMFAFCTEHLIEFVQTDYEWDDTDGNVLRAAGVGTAGVDAWEGFMVRDSELACDQRNAHGRLSDLLEA